DTSLRQALLLVEFLAANGSLLLALLAATPTPRPAAAGRPARIAFVSLVAMLVVLRFVSLAAPPTGSLATTYGFAWLAIATAVAVAFAAAAFGLAQHLGAPAPDAPLSPVVSEAGWVRDGGPVRLLGRTIVVRIAVGIPLAIIVVLAAVQGAAEGGVLALIAAGITSVVVAALQVTALAG